MKKLSALLILATASFFLLATCKKEEENKVALPSISTLAVTEISVTTAKSGGNVLNDGGGNITSKGILWSTIQNPTFEQHIGLTVEGAGAGLFQSILTGLNQNTTYYVKAYATNSAGTAYGSQVQFTTETAGSAPVAAFSASPNSGTAPLTVNFTDQSTNNPTSWLWEFGDGTTSTQRNPSKIYQNAGSYNVKLTATNSFGSNSHTKNNYITVNPAGVAPVADFTGNPTSGTAPLVVNFTDQSTNNPTTWLWEFGDGTTSTQQNPSKTYQNADSYNVKLTATNAHGSNSHTKSSYITVITGGGGGTGQPCPDMPTFTDPRDGQTYNTVQIGSQCWTKENLKYLPAVVGPGTGSETVPYYYVYDYNGTNVSAAKATANFQNYGALYNWPAALTACPSGWHLPSDGEWTQLKNYLEAQGFPNDFSNPNGAGNALKSCRQVNSPLGGDCNTTMHPRWDSSDSYGTHHGFDEFGFSALPGGGRSTNGSFDYIGIYGYWWSSTETSSTTAWYRGVYYYGGYVGRGYDGKASGYSVRCLRD